MTPLFFLLNILSSISNNSLPHIKSNFQNLETFRVCGAYCGPGWCNNKWLDEDKCDTSILPEYHKLTGFSCEDSCCRRHDKCCGQNKSLQHNCNKEIVNCLSKCDPLSLTCTFYNIPVVPISVESAMHIIDNWCCGTPCI
mgnify:CR=1 FL=1